ncbi:MAG: DUF1330 domain-containing protein [Caulobacterales bacterium]
MIYVVVTLRIYERHWMKAYNANVPAIVESYGGRYVAAGDAVEKVEGEGAAPDLVGILEFPTKQALADCLSSKEYAPYRASRMGVAMTEIIAFENLLEKSRQN